LLIIIKMETIRIDKYEIKKFTFNPLFTNTYVLNFKNKTIVIDPGNSNEEETKELIAAIKNKEIIIFNTHGHFDHIFGNNFLKKNFSDARIIIHKLDEELLKDPSLNGSENFNLNIVSPFDFLIEEDNKIFEIEDNKIKIVHTPGHTKGSISIIFDGFVFTGDTLFAGTVGIAKGYKDAFKDLIDSIKSKLLTLEDHFVVLPGHGELTTIGEERSFNPFLN